MGAMLSRLPRDENKPRDNTAKACRTAGEHAPSRRSIERRPIVERPCLREEPLGQFDMLSRYSPGVSPALQTTRESMVPSAAATVGTAARVGRVRWWSGGRDRSASVRVWPAAARSDAAQRSFPAAAAPVSPCAGGVAWMRMNRRTQLR